MLKIIKPSEIESVIGTETGLSDWIKIDQEQINKFAEATLDNQFIHVDPEAAAQTQFAGTIAHGFLTLSILSAMYYDAVPAIDCAELGVNYGFNKLRFLSPVKAGAYVRGHFTLTTVRQIKDDQLTNIWDVSVEIKGQERPALVAEWIGQQYF